MYKHTLYHKSWYAEEYDNDRFGGSFGQYLQHQEVEIFKSMINGAGGKILDVGAGTGKLSLSFMRQSRQVVSIDASSEMLKLARRKAEKEDMYLRAVICDAQHLCFRDNAFESVVSSRLLMHLADRKQGLAEFCRVAGVSRGAITPRLNSGMTGDEAMVDYRKSRYKKNRKPRTPRSMT